MKKKYTFIDLFAGIGGFHYAFHNVGSECVFASEWDTHARSTYMHNISKIQPELFKEGLFGNGENLFAGDTATEAGPPGYGGRSSGVRVLRSSC